MNMFALQIRIDAYASLLRKLYRRYFELSCEGRDEDVENLADQIRIVKSKKRRTEDKLLKKIMVCYRRAQSCLRSSSVGTVKY